MDEWIYPIFVTEGEKKKEVIPSMPGIHRFSKDRIAEEIEECLEAGIHKFMLFGVTDQKSENAWDAYREDGLVQETIRMLKNKYDSQILLATDVCLCEYTESGHCGIVDEKGTVLNDETLPVLQKIAVSHARAGADIVAPSDMMDGRVGAIRDALDENGFSDVSILSYSVKYASNLYGPFREAANSSPSFGDRKSYQMDYRNRSEAVVEAQADVEEGADMLMVKPAGMYLDIIRELKDRFHIPIAAYQVSGEYAMLANGIKQGLVSEAVVEESLLAIRRAGASVIVTYFAKQLAQKYKEEFHAI